MPDAGPRPEAQPSLTSGPLWSDLLWRGQRKSGRSAVIRLLIIAAAAWLPLFLLTLFDGTAFGSVKRPLIADFVPYARFVIAIPLLLAAEWMVNARTGTVVRYLGNSTLIETRDRAAWETALNKLMCTGDSRVAGWVIVVLAWGVSVAGISEHGHLNTVSSSWYRSSLGNLSVAGWYYALVSLPFYFLLIYRWFWRATIWVLFLRRVAAIPLRIQPTHPDLCGGLGVLWRGQVAFFGVALGLGTAVAGNLANDIVYQGSTFSAEQISIAAFIALATILIFLPLLLFTPMMTRAKEHAIPRYAALGDDLSDQFREKWIEQSEADARLIDSADASAVADYGAAYDTVSQMNVIPIRRQGVIAGALMLCIPFVPLLLLEMPLAEIFKKLISVLT